MPGSATTTMYWSSETISIANASSASVGTWPGPRPAASGPGSCRAPTIAPVMAPSSTVATSVAGGSQTQYGAGGCRGADDPLSGGDGGAAGRR
jgi:hypothetical protein